MKTKGVLFSVAMVWSMWGFADPSLKEAPVSFKLVCPPDVTVDCDDDLSDLSRWGDAYVWKDYKKVSAGQPTIKDERNSCGIGIIKRTWRVEDPYWNWHTCTQYITVRGKGLFDERDIIWPDNWTLDTCRANLDPRYLPTRYAFPKFKRKECSKPAYSYHDEYFEFGPHCAKLIRTWSVVDWCQYKPYPGSTEGKWQHIQVIKVDQKTRPEFECPKDTVFYAEECDSADIVLEDVIAISKCGDTLKVKNKSSFAEESGNNASGKYPIGIHEFYYTTEYGCGREAKCKFKIEVKPAKPPTPYCKNGIITTLMPMDTNGNGIIDIGMRDIWASDLNAGSFHSCYPDAELIYSFSEDTSDQVITFTCDNIGVNDVEIWVTDEFGNQSYCITYVVVQNNNPRLTDCMPDSLRKAMIAGNLALPDGRTIKEVEISLFGEDAAFSVQTRRDTIIDQNGNQKIVVSHDTSWYDITRKSMAMSGHYEFRDLERNRYYEISASKSKGMMNGVDIWDYYYLYFHNSPFFKISDPVALLAADINGDGKVNMFDQNLLLSAILDPSWPDAQFESWRFYDQKAFDQYLSQGFGSLDRKMKIRDLDDREMDMHFVGVKVGDIDGTVDPEGVRQNSSRERLTIGMRMELEGRNLILNFDEKVKAGQLSIYLPGANVDDLLLDGGEVKIRSKGEGWFTVLWVHNEGTEEIGMEISGKKILLSDIDVDIDAIAYNVAGTRKAITVEAYNKDELEVFSVAPNPVSDILNIDFYSPQEGTYDIIIYTISGQQVYQRPLGSFDNGQTQISIDVSDMSTGIMYYFKLRNQHSTAVGSFVK
ncbi:MAG: T9SS type A sorting domain-containing protein [Saprospiraceae bacterium]|nr:T9SS type A sorting domain-containing protein [Saprospiraceae bacterium]